MCRLKIDVNDAESRELFHICEKHSPADMPDLQGGCIICEYQQQTIGELTEKEIDDAFKKGSGLWPSSLADRTHWSIDTRRIRAGLREVEASVRRAKNAK